VVVVRADWCPTCRRIEPTVTALQREYAGRVSFLVLDVTDDATSARSTVAAEQAGVVRVHTGIVRGEAAPAIVAEAKRQQADLIVIGAHGQTGLTRFLMGNTAETVLRTAPCATLLLKSPDN